MTSIQIKFDKLNFMHIFSKCIRLLDFHSFSYIQKNTESSESPSILRFVGYRPSLAGQCPRWKVEGPIFRLTRPKTSIRALNAQWVMGAVFVGLVMVHENVVDVIGDGDIL